VSSHRLKIINSYRADLLAEAAPRRQRLLTTLSSPLMCDMALSVFDIHVDAA